MGRHGATCVPPESPLLPSLAGAGPLLSANHTRNVWRHDIACTRRVTDLDSGLDGNARKPNWPDAITPQNRIPRLWSPGHLPRDLGLCARAARRGTERRSEEHTSELQS